MNVEAWRKNEHADSFDKLQQGFHAHRGGLLQAR
jgi:hypothetical protein